MIFLIQRVYIVIKSQCVLPSTLWQLHTVKCVNHVTSYLTQTLSLLGSRTIAWWPLDDQGTTGICAPRASWGGHQAQGHPPWWERGHLCQGHQDRKGGWSQWVEQIVFTRLFTMATTGRDGSVYTTAGILRTMQFWPIASKYGYVIILLLWQAYIL